MGDTAMQAMLAEYTEAGKATKFPAKCGRVYALMYLIATNQFCQGIHFIWVTWLLALAQSRPLP